MAASQNLVTLLARHHLRALERDPQLYSEDWNFPSEKNPAISYARSSDDSERAI